MPSLSCCGEDSRTCRRCRPEYSAARCVVSFDAPRRFAFRSTTGTGRDSSLLAFLDNTKGTDELYEMLRTRSAAEIESLCTAYPIEQLRLDWSSVQNDFRNNQRFELVTVLAQVLVRYDEILKTSPERRLPRTLPAKKFADILMARLMPFISSQQKVELAHGLRIRLYDFAMA